MLVIVPASFHDKNLITAFCKVVNFFGPYPTHELLTVSRPADAQYSKKILDALSGGFAKSSQHIFDENGPAGWPLGPNFYWHQTIQYLKKTNNSSSWLWMELDMTPIAENWLDVLNKEYIDKGTDCLGTIQRNKNSTNHHFVGAGIYPADFYKKYTSWKSVLDSSVAFDVFCQHEIVPSASNSSFIDHKFRTSYFKCTNEGLRGLSSDKSPEFSQPVRDDCVLVHGCVDSSLANLILNDHSYIFTAT